MFAVKRIMVPVVFSEGCRGAVHCALEISRQLGSDVTVVHVAESLDKIFVGAESRVGLNDAEQRRTEALSEQLQSFAPASVNGRIVKTALLQGDAATEITRFAHAEDIDLIVMPTRGFGTFRRLLMGSVTAKILHDAACPVWTGTHVEQSLPPEGVRFRTVACAIDLGPQSNATLDWAAGFAREFKATMLALHAVASTGDAEWDGRLCRMARQALTEQLTGMDIQADIQIAFGKPATTICELAKQLDTDVLVIGRGHGSAGGGRLPTDAYTIIRDAHCPVVSV